MGWWAGGLVSWFGQGWICFTNSCKSRRRVPQGKGIFHMENCYALEHMKTHLFPSLFSQNVWHGRRTIHFSNKGRRDDLSEGPFCDTGHSWATRKINARNGAEGPGKAPSLVTEQLLMHIVCMWVHLCLCPSVYPHPGPKSWSQLQNLIFLIPHSAAEKRSYLWWLRQNPALCVSTYVWPVAMVTQKRWHAQRMK